MLTRTDAGPQSLSCCPCPSDRPPPLSQVERDSSELSFAADGFNSVPWPCKWDVAAVDSLCSVGHLFGRMGTGRLHFTQ